jgi:hypothetical protein
VSQPYTAPSRPAAEVAPFVWKDYSRFVQVAPVARGWLVLWGQYLDQGRARRLDGNRTYVDLVGARRRVADAVFELTHDDALVAEALHRFDRTPFPLHTRSVLPDPL